MPDDQSQYPDNTDTVNTFIPPPSLMKVGPSCYQRMPDDPTPFIQDEAVLSLKCTLEKNGFRS